MGKSSQPFYLKDNSIYEALRLIQLKYKNIKFKVERSPNKNSNSIYIRILNESQTVNTSLRISDHDTYLTKQGGGINNYIIGKRTTIKNVMNKIEESISILRRKEAFTILDQLEQ